MGPNLLAAAAPKALRKSLEDPLWYWETTQPFWGGTSSKAAVKNAHAFLHMMIMTCLCLTLLSPP